MQSNQTIEFQFSNGEQAAPRKSRNPLKVTGLFSGIGGLEKGLHEAGHETRLFCEVEPGAKAVLTKHFPNVPIHDDVQTLTNLPAETELLTGGFPCQDLSQAGKLQGILNGKNSSLVTEIFRLVQNHQTPWVMLENVKFMLALDSGKAMHVLTDAFEHLGYKWAYRVVNSMSFGVPQRRERVIFIASKEHDPREILFGDNAEQPIFDKDQVGKSACGFYWTEGLKGLGWAVNAVPPLKGGSTIGIPSSPAILLPNGLLGTPDIRDAERMQGFPIDWTLPSSTVRKESHRWYLIGNALTVGLSRWIGERFINPAPWNESTPCWSMDRNSKWALGGWNVGDGKYALDISAFPLTYEPIELESWLRYPLKPLSSRASKGFLSRAERANLRFPPNFLDAVREHIGKVS
jgi:DNA (cytosine-5)-methyltransferase 1